MDNENFVKSTAIFAVIKGRVISKDLQRGELCVVFGGVELDLSNADIQKNATLSLGQIFGEVKLIIPADWQVRMEVTHFFSSIHDKRPTSMDDASAEAKVLVIKGFSIFGGIEIR